LGQSLPANDRCQAYLRASLDWDAEGELTVTPFVQQDNAMLTTLAAADCLIVRPPEAPAAATGDRVEILRLDSGLLST
jgi:molybdopterin molybdotransferase